MCRCSRAGEDIGADCVEPARGSAKSDDRVEFLREARRRRARDEQVDRRLQHVDVVVEDRSHGGGVLGENRIIARRQVFSELHESPLQPPAQRRDLTKSRAMAKCPEQLIRGVLEDHRLGKDAAKTPPCILSRALSRSLVGQHGHRAHICFGPTTG